MTTTPAMPELPDAAVLAAARELCKIHAGQCGVDYDDTWAIYSEQFKADARACLEAAAYALAALQSAQPAAVSDERAALAEQLRNIANGVRICGVSNRRFVGDRLDEIARAILALRPQAVPMTDAWNWLTEANIDAYLEDYEMRGEDEAGRDASYTPTEGDRALLKDFVFGLLTEAQEAHHGITAQAKGGE